MLPRSHQATEANSAAGTAVSSVSRSWNPSAPIARPIPLSSRSHVNRIDEGLSGALGAQKIIAQLNTHRSPVTRITLSHNSLGDQGVSLLFTFLCSPAGARHRNNISEISLTSNGIGCRGLQAIAEYIQDNEALKTVWIANNNLVFDPAAFSALADALNSSRLRFLSVTGNPRLGDAFAAGFLPLLRSPHLQELHINNVGLTRKSGSVIAEWVAGSGKGGGLCALTTLKCSANSLGIRGVWQVIRAVQRGNWSLTKLEMYANHLAGPQDAEEEDLSEESADGEPLIRETEDAWKESEHALHMAIRRNANMKRETEKEALNLLRYSRPLLVRPKSVPASAPSLPPSPPTDSSCLFPFHALPVELKLHILALLTQTLSSAQRTRIYNYASDPLTLPPLLPALRRDASRGCLADPSNFLGASIGFEVLGATSTGKGCADGKCMGIGNSLLCRREEERTRFLETVGCRVYEPEPMGEV
ncbi:hypothetical protein BV22DRAFT_1126441 [Leucogyrophana mollusca]|uniref:Uncharacterized protein n=1 Tax=Leucogyrophana mollusca TaxID=85980 RepID=A0ACB8BRS5_9AGAM|nr:hypothetical protein BV22DRAFT_1126441 [Leucogyrophana mollusca]